MASGPRFLGYEGRDMAVKSSTKKRRMELGISEQHAHRLADDANMDAIKRMTVEQVAKKLELDMESQDLENVMAVIREQINSRKRSRTGRITLSRKAILDSDIPTRDARYNVLNHILVPHHEIVPVEEEEASLAPWDMMVNNADGSKRLAKELLPKILITDPAIQAIKESVETEDDELPAGWLTNRVVRIVRYSRSAGSSTAFRLIVESA